MKNKKVKNVVAIIVPHGDDEVLGFGGVIQRHILNKNEVHVVFARKPIDQRTQTQFDNIKDAQKILGYQHMHCLEMSEIEMTHEPLTFFRKLESLLTQINPNIVYTTFYGDIHQDHKTVFDWVCRAVRVWGPLNVKQFYVGEIISSTDQYPTITGKVFTPNHYLTLTSQEFEKKVKALKCYTTEIRKNPHPRSEYGIISKLLERGRESGDNFAEAFMCLRYIE